MVAERGRALGKVPAADAFWVLALRLAAVSSLESFLALASAGTWNSPLVPALAIMVETSFELAVRPVLGVLPAKDPSGAGHLLSVSLILAD